MTNATEPYVYVKCFLLMAPYWFNIVLYRKYTIIS